MRILFQIFLIFFKIGALSFGGGYVMIPFIQKEIVNTYNWIATDEFVDIIGISQMTPGPIAVNAATYVGYKIAGVLGSLFGTLGVIITAFILALFISTQFHNFKGSKHIRNMFKALRPAVLGLIFSAGVVVFVATIKSFTDVLIFGAVIVSVIRFKVNPILAILISGILGIFIF